MELSHPPMIATTVGAQRVPVHTRAAGKHVRRTRSLHCPGFRPAAHGQALGTGAISLRPTSLVSLFRGVSRRREYSRPAVVNTQAYQVDSSQVFKLKGGAEVFVSISGSQVTFTCKPPKAASRKWQTPRLTLHWGLLAEEGAKWSLPDKASWPAGTKLYKKSALRTPFVFTDPSAAHGGPATLSIQLENAGSLHALTFLLLDTRTKDWHKNNGSDFLVYLGGLASDHEVMLPDELVRVWAYHNWENAGKPKLSAVDTMEAVVAAEQEVVQLLRGGQQLPELMASMGLRYDNPTESPELDAENLPPVPAARAPAPPAPRAPTPPAPPKPSAPTAPPVPPVAPRVVMPQAAPVPPKAVAPPPAPVAPPPVPAPPPPPPPPPAPAARPAKRVEAPEELVGIRAYIMWEEAGCPDGADFGGQAREEIQAACDAGLAPGEIERRLKTGVPLFDGAAPPPKKGKKAPPPPPPASKQRRVRHGGVDEGLLRDPEGAFSPHGDAHWMKDRIAGEEDGCRRSLMHRYNAALGMVEDARGAGADAEPAFALIYVWLRFSEIRQLVWNRNYNIKPREISAAQGRLTDTLCDIFTNQRSLRQLARMAMASIGRGAEGNAGQRIRDEILDVQRANNAMGGMMEEWHQKLHNNTTPDDVIICQALLDYMDAGLDMGKYWETLHEGGIDKERLLSYDRAIHSEPDIKPEQVEGLHRDLTKYMVTLKAVHSGADLDSAANYVFGYSQSQCKGASVSVERIPAVATDELKAALRTIQDDLAAQRHARLHRSHDSVDPLLVLEAVMHARQILRPHLRGNDNLNGRLKDVVYLDLALETTARVVVEGSLGSLEQRGLAAVAAAVTLALENACLSLCDNEELVLCWREWSEVAKQVGGGEDWALRAKAALDRIMNHLGSLSDRYTGRLQPLAEALGPAVGVDQHAVALFSEEIIRGTPATPLSLLLRRVDPLLRQAADLGSWQVISAEQVTGYVDVVDDIATVQNDVYPRPTVVVAARVSGEEEIPEGCVGVLTSDMPDVLAHISVRARNEGVAFCTSFNPADLEHIRTLAGRPVTVTPRGNEVTVVEVSADAVSTSSAGAAAAGPGGAQIEIEERVFCGQWALQAPQFAPTNVGGKSRNLSGLHGKLDASIRLPASVALPFGTCDAVLADPVNAHIQAKLGPLLQNLDVDQLEEVQGLLREVQAPPALVAALQAAMEGTGLPWPGTDGPERWAAAWRAICGVWASKYNPRSFISCRKAGIDHRLVSMAVLCQQVVPAEYSFVIHTTNPQTGNKGEIYAEVVRGLGEVLVGNYPGRALSFIANKADLGNPRVVGFPSKSVGLFAPPSLIFRSDSNGEDLEGYAGAGLYDSIIMDHAEERPIDYSIDPIVQDHAFQKSMMFAIASAGAAIENVLGSPQDIEGCVTATGELYIVQTRPQV